MLFCLPVSNCISELPVMQPIQGQPHFTEIEVEILLSFTYESRGTPPHIHLLNHRYHRLLIQYFNYSRTP